MKIRAAVSGHRLAPLAALALLSLLMLGPRQPLRPPEVASCSKVVTHTCTTEEIQAACVQFCSMTATCGLQKATCGNKTVDGSSTTPMTYDCTCDCMPGSTCISGMCVGNSQLDMSSTDLAEGPDLATGSTALCSANAVFTEDTADHSTPGNAETFTAPSNAAGTVIVVTGPASGGGYGMPLGYMKVGGFTPGQMVHADLALAPNCAATGCSGTVTITVSGATGSSTDLYGPSGCGPTGGGTVTADASGVVTIFSDPAGTNGNNNVVVLTAK